MQIFKRVVLFRWNPTPFQSVRTHLFRVGAQSVVTRGQEGLGQ
jgi:hypothetical protein